MAGRSHLLARALWASPRQHGWTEWPLHSLQVCTHTNTLGDTQVHTFPPQMDPHRRVPGMSHTDVDAFCLVMCHHTFTASSHGPGPHRAQVRRHPHRCLCLPVLRATCTQACTPEHCLALFPASPLASPCSPCGPSLKSDHGTALPGILPWCPVAPGVEARLPARPSTPRVIDLSLHLRHG